MLSYDPTSSDELSVPSLPGGGGVAVVVGLTCSAASLGATSRFALRWHAVDCGRNRKHKYWYYTNTFIYSKELL